MGSVAFVQIGRGRPYYAPKRQCKQSVDLTKITSSSPNPMIDNYNYTTCFDLSLINITGDDSVKNILTFEFCKNGSSTGVTCASEEKRNNWAEEKTLYMYSQDLFIDYKNFDEPLRG